MYKLFNHTYIPLNGIILYGRYNIPLVDELFV